MYLLGATKATVEALTRSWAELLGSNPATASTIVNAISVGATATDSLLQNAPDELKQHTITVLQTGNPTSGSMGLGQPEDVVDIAGLIISDKAGWVTGGIVCANGGT